MSTTPASLLSTLADPDGSLDDKIDLLKTLLADGRPPSRKLIKAVLDSIGSSNADADVKVKQEMLTELINQLKQGPLKLVVFLGLLDSTSPPRGEILFEDGVSGFCTIQDHDLAEKLKPGDQVLCDQKGFLILRMATQRLVGEEAELTRKINSRYVEVSNGHQQKLVMLASQTLLDKLNTKETAIGATVIVNERQKFAYDALPAPDGQAHYKFLSRESVPDVMVDRDIGNPPKCIGEITEIIRLELSRPELRRRYGLRRTTMKLLAGVSGSGKTLAIQAIHRKMYQEMASHAGVGLADLPPRVFRLKLSSVLSMWLGESDKNLDRFFAEVEQMADEPFVSPNGKKYTLPVLAIMEEVDGLARQRGGEQHHDRILTTALQRLDSSRPEMKNKLIVFIGTTNDAHNVDRAFLRRIGGSIEQFGRLDKDGFHSVLTKHLNKVPVEPPARNCTLGLIDWFFNQNGDDEPLVELSYHNCRSGPAPFYRRDFLTGAVVDCAVQQAAASALQAELKKVGEGINYAMLMVAFDQQISAIADQLTEHNVHHYLDLPSGAVVQNLKRIKN